LNKVKCTLNGQEQLMRWCWYLVSEG